MTTYLVTTELRTTLWVRVCRFFKLKKKREEFYITLNYEGYVKGDILELDYNTTGLMILKKK
jgi:hypothetical protein